MVPVFFRKRYYCLDYGGVFMYDDSFEKYKRGLHEDV